MNKATKLLSRVCITLSLVSLISCGSGGGSNNSPVQTSTPVTQPPTPAEPEFVVQHEYTLTSDGVNSGLSAHELIEAVFASGSIESPDLYSNDHNNVLHIYEGSDSIVGDHFVFLAHLEDDGDRGSFVDRQRNEIKAYDKSDDELLAYENESFQYTWKFKVSEDMELSSRFSHFFQLKARNSTDSDANGNDQQPIITLSGAERSSTGNQLQVRYSAGKNPSTGEVSTDYLIETDWFQITDEWVSVFVQANFSEQGSLKLTLTRMSDNKTIIDLNVENIDLWRGENAEDFVRPKWGIYRSVAEPTSLRTNEEQVRFADFVIQKGTITL